MDFLALLSPLAFWVSFVNSPYTFISFESENFQTQLPEYLFIKYSGNWVRKFSDSGIGTGLSVSYPRQDFLKRSISKIGIGYLASDGYEDRYEKSKFDEDENRNRDINNKWR